MASGLYRDNTIQILKQSTPLLRCNAVRQTVANPDSQRKTTRKEEKKMKQVNTKTVAEAYIRYLNSRTYTLNQCYTKHSYAKDMAFEYCIDLMRRYDGYGLKIIGYNQMTFSAGFIGIYDGDESFFYITVNYDRVMTLSDISNKLN